MSIEDAEEYSFVTWSVNGVPVLDAPWVLTGRYFNKHDRVACEAVRYVDGRRDARLCQEIVIGNSVPQIDETVIRAGSRLPWDPLAAAALGWDDADGDLPGFLIVWLVNGMPAAESSPTFQSLSLLPGDQVVAMVTPFDGENFGAPKTSAPAVIAPVETPVVIDLYAASAATVITGRSVTFRWETAGADACTLAGEALPAEMLVSGSREYAVTAPTLYRLACFGSGGPAVAELTVDVLPEPPSIDAFEALLPVINYMEQTALVWSASQTDGCTFDGVAMDLTTVTVQPLADTEYTLECSGIGGRVTATTAISVRRPRINEVAWMGTLTDPNDEWIELFNAGTEDVDLDGWRLRAADGSPDVLFTQVLPAGGYWLLERTGDDSVPGVTADLIYAGGLGNGGEALALLDSYGRVVDSIGAGVWPAGDAATKAAMERIGSRTAGDAWATSTVPYASGLGTPRAANSKLGYPVGGTSLAGIQVWPSEHANVVMPAHGPGAMAQGLATAIDQTQSSIDFALYGVQGSPEVRAALLRAVARGVAVRGVVDADRAGWYAYRDTRAFMDELPAGAVRADESDALMHNKFVVFDHARVWTGSANVADTDTNAEYNCNVAVLIDSTALAAAFTHEFAQMFAGKFHRAKQGQPVTVFPRMADGTLLEVYFAPQGDARRNAIIRAIDGAKSSIQATIFFMTDAAVAAALVGAHQRGVDVRMIVDAVGAAHPASRHAALRSAGIRVKTENWAGKAHAKMLLADGYVAVLGSQNWTEAGNRENDENTLYIENQALTAVLGAHFDDDWELISERWLADDPRAESVDSPGTLSDLLDNDSDGLVDEGAPQQLMYVNDAEGAINAYFNKSVLHAYATLGNRANGNVSFVERFLYRLNAVTQAVEMTAYELNQPALVDTLLAKADGGVAVRIVVDGKAPPPTDELAVARYEQMRLQLERLARGSDGIIGTSDDVKLLADSPVFAVEDPDLRVAAGLPTAATDVAARAVWIGSAEVAGRMFIDAERKPDGVSYYAAGDQMHHKFAVFDGQWLWTGSWNPATDGSGLITTDQAIEFHDAALSRAFQRQFTTLWGSAGLTPNPQLARFHGRKPPQPPETFFIAGRKVEIAFSPGGEVLERLRALATEATQGAYFSIFAWSDQALTDVFKQKWEGSSLPGIGTPTGFRLAGVFDRAFWNQWWSASADMRGLAPQGSAQNPLVPWAFTPPIVSDGEDRTLHTKVLVLDPAGARPTVVLGSANWGANGNETNDDHIVVVIDQALANQFMQHFWARYFMGGGRVPPAE